MMKTVYKTTLLATATMCFCGLVAAQSGHARLGARETLGPGPSMEPSIAPAANASAARGFDPTATPRLPVLMLTQSYGDSAREMFAGGAVGYTLQNFPFQSTKTIVYLDVDTFNPNSRLNREALALAKEAGWPVVIESESWNAKRVAQVAAMLYPEAAGTRLANTSVIVEAGAGGTSVRDTWPSEVAVEAGIPFAQTTEGAVALAAKASGDYKPVHWSVHFAKMAYSRNPGDFFYENKKWSLGYNRDVVKTWGYWNPQVGYQCIVAFRGSQDPEDWKTNFKSQFLTSVDVPGIPDRWKGQGIKIGKGYADRLANMNFDESLQCTEVYVTGHSLGGAMSEAYALRELLQQNDSWFSPENIRGVYVYNPARLGTSKASRTFVNLMRAPATQWGIPYNKWDSRGLRSYCRSGDPVWYLPAGFVHGTAAYVNNGSQCTHAGAYKGWNQASPASVKFNHSVDRWFYQD